MEGFPETDLLLAQSPYEPFTDPAMNVCERLIILVHLGFNPDIWAKNKERTKRYWMALLERVQGAAYSEYVYEWWSQTTADLEALPLQSTALLHEKNLLLDPRNYNLTDFDVLTVLRGNGLPYIVDRVRIWNRERK